MFLMEMYFLIQLECVVFMYLRQWKNVRLEVNVLMDSVLIVYKVTV